MANIKVFENWTTADISQAARPFIQDIDEAQRRQGNSGAILAKLGDYANHILRYSPRVIFSKMIPWGASDHTGIDPLLVWKYFDGNENGRSLDVRVLFFPRYAGAGDAEIAQDTASDIPSAGPITSFQRNQTFSSIDLYRSIESGFYKVSRGDANDAEIVDGLSSFNGLTVAGVIVQESKLSYLDSVNETYVPTGDLVKGEKVLSAGVTSLVDGIHACRKNQLPIVWSWCSLGNTATPSTSDETGIHVTSATYVNAFDQTITTRTATSPGGCTNGWYCGIGNVNTGSGNQVKVMCRVLANATVGNGTVKFEGPDHAASNLTEITVTGGGGLDWYGDDTNFIYLNSESGWSDSTTARNKIDALLKVASDDLYVYGIRCWMVYNGY